MCHNSYFIGNRITADAEISTVSRIVRIPSDSFETKGRQVARKLARKLTATRTPTTRFFLAGGIMIAINMP